jgi:ParB family chromosome partitioning protein
MSKDRRLGKGLAALLGTPDSSPKAEVAGAETVRDTRKRGQASPPTEGRTHLRLRTEDDDVGQGEAAETIEATALGGDVLLHLSVHEIDDNPFQPRRDFNDAEINSLAESLREHEMLQPILVRMMGGRYQLISGERRLRAAIRAGWSKVPARLREADDRLVAELAIVENLQRKDLNPIEKALSFRRYLDEHRCTQDDLAKRLTIDRSTIANLIRLLELPEKVLESLRNGEVSAGHARALLPLGEEASQLEFCALVQRDGWSVRETERRVQEHIIEQDGLQTLSAKTRATPSAKRSEHVGVLEQEFRHALGTKVDIRATKTGRGKIVIHFKNHEEYQRLRDALLDDRE